MEKIRTSIYVARYRNPVISILIDTTWREYRFLIFLLMCSAIAKVMMNLNPQGVLSAYILICFLKVARKYFYNLKQYYEFKEIAYDIPEVKDNLRKAPELDPKDWYLWASMETYDLWVKRQELLWRFTHPHLDFFADTLIMVAVFTLIVIAIF